ncbi:MAG: hypothetical protein LBN39_12110 [Planctomycetaceae bacterium]|jgi:DNA polymerase-3 subunit delta'|nr:hypothetical protein [Planctomycetaceae bacterium]
MWCGIQGHDANVERFRRSAQRGRLAGTFLFAGTAGVGKRMFAFALAQGILCKGNGGRSIEPCGTCDSCKLFGTQPPSHPDLYYVCKPADKASLPLELLVGDKKSGGRAGLCADIYRTPFLGHRKVAILDDADYLSESGASAANVMLKTLEEPPPDAVIILIGTSASKQLPTIRSRCQIVRFAPLPLKILATLLAKNEAVETLEQGLKLARRAEGSYDQALELYDDAVDGTFQQFCKQLAQKNFDAVANAAKINELIDGAGKESPLKRRRLRLFLHLSVHHFREVMKSKPATDFRPAMRMLEQTLDALAQIDRNAALPVIVENWCSRLK